MAKSHGARARENGPGDVLVRALRHGLLLGALALSACKMQPAAVPEQSTARQPLPEAEATPALSDFVATAYALPGTTASGGQTRRGIVAADPKLLPLGSRIRIHGAGRYSDEYLVADTGAKIVGRRIDIYMPSAKEARHFGRRRVQVEVLDAESSAD